MGWGRDGRLVGSWELIGRKVPLGKGTFLANRGGFDRQQRRPSSAPFVPIAGRRPATLTYTLPKASSADTTTHSQFELPLATLTTITV